MKKWFAAIAAVVVVVAVAGCGSSESDNTSTASTTPSTSEITDWKTAGVEGQHALTGCIAQYDAVTFACYHLNLLRLDQRMSNLPEETRDIRNGIRTYQTNYGRWASHKCGTPDTDDNADLCSSLYQRWLNDSLASLREGFDNLSNGRPI